MPSLPNKSGSGMRLDGKLDPTLPIPLYHQAYTVMRNWITSGSAFASGDRFPSENELCDILGVSRITIKRALSDLAAEGLVSRHRGRGTVVEAPKSRSVIRADFGEMMKNLLDVAQTTQVELLGEKWITPPDNVLDDLDLESGIQALQILRRRLLDGAPYVYTVSFIPADIADRLPKKGAGQISMIQLLTEAGLPPLEAYQSMTATSANTEIAGHLELNVGDPVLMVVRLFKTAELRAVQHTTMYFRPDRYEYTLVLPASEALE